MELWTSALSYWKCHWPNLKSAGLFRQNLFRNPLKPQHSIPCWLFVQWEPSAYRSCQYCQKQGSSKFVGGFTLFGLLGSGRASMLPMESLSLGLWVIAVDPAFIACHQRIKNCGIWIDQLNHLSAVMTMSFFLIFSEHPWDKLCKSSASSVPHEVPTLTSNCALIVSIDTRWSLSMKFFIWPNNYCVLTSLLLSQLSSSLTDSLPSLNLLCHPKTDAQFLQDGPKAVWSIPYVSVGFFPRLKQNFIAYCSYKVPSHPDCILKFTSCDNQV